MLSACPVSWWGTWGKSVFALQWGSKYKMCETPHFLSGSVKFRGKELFCSPLFGDLLSFLIYSLSISLVVCYLWVVACEVLNPHSTLKGWQLSFHLQCSTEDSNQQPFNSEAFLFATTPCCFSPSFFAFHCLLIFGCVLPHNQDDLLRTVGVYCAQLKTFCSKS